MNIDKLESISKIIAAIFIPLTLAFMGNNLTEANKQKDTEVKLIELATIILNREPSSNMTEETKNIRIWAVNVINTYSAVKMETATQNALVNKIALPAIAKSNEEQFITYGVIFGGDTTLEQALYETQTRAKKIGIDNAQVFLRSGSYRSVVIVNSKPDAEEILGKLKEIKKDAFIIDMTKWCPNTTSYQKYFECKLNTQN